MAKRKRKLRLPPDQASDRDLSTLLSYGPSFLPYVAAWTDSRIEQVRNFKHWVYIAIRTIAKQVSSQVPNVSWTYHNSMNQPRANYLRSKALIPLLSHEDLEPVPNKHPLLRLLKDPNDPDTSYDLWYETIMFHHLTGIAYWWMPKNALGLPAAIWVVPSHWMWPIVGQDKLIEGYEIRPIEGNYFRKFLPIDEIVVFKDKSPISKIDGYSPLTAGAQWADTAEMINRSRWHSYKNGTFPTVAVQFDGKFQDPSDEDLRRIEAKFMSRYTGETRSNKPMFLPPGVSVNPLSLGINQMLFGETATEIRDNLLALFGVPASAAGLSKDMTYGSVMASHAGFMQQTINPLLRYFGQVITEKVARRYDDSLKVWWEDITPHDPELIEKQIQTDLMCGAITPNEVRVMRGREPYPTTWGDTPVLPVNVASSPMGGQHAPVTAPLSNPNDNKGYTP